MGKQTKDNQPGVNRLSKQPKPLKRVKNASLIIDKFIDKAETLRDEWVTAGIENTQEHWIKEIKILCKMTLKVIDEREKNMLVNDELER